MAHSSSQQMELAGSAGSAAGVIISEESVAELVKRAWEFHGVRVSLSHAELVLQRQQGNKHKALAYLAQTADGANLSPGLTTDLVAFSAAGSSPVASKNILSVSGYSAESSMIVGTVDQGEMLRIEILKIQQKLTHRKERGRQYSEQIFAELSQSGDERSCFTILEEFAKLEFIEMACIKHSEVTKIHSSLIGQLQMNHEQQMQIEQQFHREQQAQMELQMQREKQMHMHMQQQQVISTTAGPAVHSAPLHSTHQIGMQQMTVPVVQLVPVVQAVSPVFHETRTQRTEVDELSFVLTQLSG